MFGCCGVASAPATESINSAAITTPRFRHGDVSRASVHLAHDPTPRLDDEAAVERHTCVAMNVPMAPNAATAHDPRGSLVA
jgi:hypothetical protein